MLHHSEPFPQYRDLPRSNREFIIGVSLYRTPMLKTISVCSRRLISAKEARESRQGPAAFFENLFSGRVKEVVLKASA